MRLRIRQLVAIAIVSLATATAASAAHVVVPYGVYKGKDLKGASFTIAASGRRASFHGRVIVGLLCGSKAPPTGQSAAKLVLDPASAPSLKINNSTGSFTGTRRSNGDTVTIAGSFSANARTMSFTVKTSGDCSSSKYTFHSS